MRNNLPIITENDLFKNNKIQYSIYGLNFKLTNDITITRINLRHNKNTKSVVYGTEVMFSNELYILVRCDWFNSYICKPQVSSRYEYMINDKKITIIDIYTLKYPNMFIFRCVQS